MDRATATRGELGRRLVELVKVDEQAARRIAELFSVLARSGEPWMSHADVERIVCRPEHPAYYDYLELHKVRQGILISRQERTKIVLELQRREAEASA